MIRHHRLGPGRGGRPPVGPLGLSACDVDGRFREDGSVVGRWFVPQPVARGPHGKRRWRTGPAAAWGITPPAPSAWGVGTHSGSDGTSGAGPVRRPGGGHGRPRIDLGRTGAAAAARWCDEGLWGGEVPTDSLVMAVVGAGGEVVVGDGVFLAVERAGHPGGGRRVGCGAGATPGGWVVRRDHVEPALSRCCWANAWACAIGSCGSPGIDVPVLGAPVLDVDGAFGPVVARSTTSLGPVCGVE